MDASALRDLLQRLPGEIDKAAAQVKNIVEEATVLYDRYEKFIPKSGGSGPWDFLKDNVQAPMSREQKIQWLKDNVAGINVAGIDALSDDLVNEVYGYWYNRGKGV